MAVCFHRWHQRTLPGHAWWRGFFLIVPLVPLLLLSACTQPPSGGTASDIENVLYGVVALSPTDVWAVGSMSSRANPTFRQQVLLEHWDGARWQAVPAAIPGILFGVAAVDANDIWAVGQAPSDLPLILHWNGAAWSQVQSPSLTQPHALSGVAAVSAQDVWAVGGRNERSPLILHWDGQRWSMVPPAAPPTFRAGSLRSVRALSSTNVWAVGWYIPLSGGAQHTLAEHWDGQNWQYVATPGYAEDHRLGGDATLDDLTALADGTLWAVGEEMANCSSCDLARPLAEHWMGAQWQVVETLAPAHPAYSFAQTVFAMNAHTFLIAGYWYSPTRYTNAPLLLQGDGQSWQMAALSVLPSSSVFWAGTAVSANEGWVVGSTGEVVAPAPGNGAMQSQTLIEHWDGTRWSRVPSPNPGQSIPPLGQA